MARLLGMMRTDVTVQWRNRLYYIGIALSVFVALGMTAAFAPTVLGFVLPQILTFTIGGTALMYILGMVIFEKDEGTLNALLVTPLTNGEYIWSKVVTLALLALVETLITLILTVGLQGYDIGYVVLGVVLMSPIWTLAGFILVVRYDSITDALLPMIVIVLGLQLPLLHFGGLVVSDLWYLIPMTAPITLLRGGWVPLEAWEIAYGVGYSVIAIYALYRWAVHAFYTHIVLKG